MKTQSKNLAFIERIMRDENNKQTHITVDIFAEPETDAPGPNVGRWTQGKIVTDQQEHLVEGIMYRTREEVAISVFRQFYKDTFFGKVKAE